jgi:hypothetical protein
MTTSSPIFSIDTLLANIAILSDLPSEVRVMAETEYKEIGNHLASMQADGWDVYPQGSMLIGTVVRPIGDAGFDLDMVCLRNVAKQSTTQQKLKDEVGQALKAYVDRANTKPNEVSPSRRCWVVDYPDDSGHGGLHIDVLPAIPDVDARSDTAIEITDKALRLWQPSNPKAYAAWFNGCTAKQRRAIKEAMATKMSKSVDEIPDWEVKTTLQRVVQVLKLHRDQYFEGRDSDLRPPSILITTLAAYAFGGEQELAEAVVSCVRGMPGHVNQLNGIYLVQSPVSLENFADKWNEYPERRAAFYDWMEKVRRDIDEAGAEEGMDRVGASLAKSFGESRVASAARRMGIEIRESRDAGKLTFAAGAGGLGAAAAGAAIVPQHKFYGRKHP